MPTYLALLQAILSGLAQAPAALQIATDAYNSVRETFSTDDQAALDKMFADAKAKDAADTAQAVTDLNQAAQEG